LIKVIWLTLEAYKKLLDEELKEFEKEKLKSNWDLTR